MFLLTTLLREICAVKICNAAGEEFLVVKPKASAQKISTGYHLPFIGQYLMSGFTLKWGSIRRRVCPLVESDFCGMLDKPVVFYAGYWLLSCKQVQSHFSRV